MFILGVRIDNFSKTQILAKISEFLRNQKGHQNHSTSRQANFFITTPNPEMLVDAEHDWFFKEALNKADLAVADGFGLALAARYLYGEKTMRWAGADLMEKICEICAREGQSVYLLGGEEGIAEKAAAELQRKYPGLKIAGAEKGMMMRHHRDCFAPAIVSGLAMTQNDGDLHYLVGLDFNHEENEKILERIQYVAPDVLFVAFGHGKQEKWLAEFLPRLPSVQIGMGVGGTFDYLAGEARRAPYFMRALGWEWLWRLLVEPWRAKRIWKAVISFSLLVKDYKIQLSLPYRQGVIGFIVNREGKFFIAKRCAPPDPYFHYIDHWQPPQGGINRGETAERAILKEIKEETGMKVEVAARCKTPHQYDWSIKFMSKKGKGYHFRGQQKTIFLLKYEGDGSDIKLDGQELCDYRWVDLEELKEIIHPVRRPSLEILLKEIKI